ncbi:START domain-containing protein 10-like [Toxorhynchites rutilus septentrionalis]|uniref:START domain-containing protein 10-like n=1 Tax=Toxorhynchites rutilus septentrionalis TaxID=329112 RepID=UPI00247AC7AE|nr:START domain-containing protein 10-like [Toxorhynchites rutilus septentrionalis]XP_055642991.1 START domain-containing protein 10-like [Toxorhynchites rutilus septentrionalis]XP_055642993.1 START domain-containing protein 10-like [Toxorhynchites rutilus septentrionalis]
MARIAEDSDFEALKRLVDDHEGWTLELSKSDTQVYTRPVAGCNFNMVKIHTEFADVTADILFDVLHDPDYRKVWDSHMLASEEIGVLNVNNDVGYYAMSCPPPLKPRDFVLQRSWLDTGPRGEQMLLSRSVPHKNYPPKKGYVRAMSYITGFVLRTKDPSKTGCMLNYVAHCDPQGTLPPWLVNKVTHTLGPRMVKDLKKAALGYVVWKQSQPHLRKPWRFPEEISCPRISIDDCSELSATPTVRALPQIPTTPAANGKIIAAKITNSETTPSMETTSNILSLGTTAGKNNKPDKKSKKMLEKKEKSDAKLCASNANGASSSNKKDEKKAKKESKDDSSVKNKKNEGGLKKRRSLLSLKF